MEGHCDSCSRIVVNALQKDQINLCFGYSLPISSHANLPSTALIVREAKHRTSNVDERTSTNSSSSSGRPCCSSCSLGGAHERVGLPAEWRQVRRLEHGFDARTRAARVVGVRAPERPRERVHRHELQKHSAQMNSTQMHFWNRNGDNIEC